MEVIWKRYIDVANQHLIVYSISESFGRFLHYAKAQALFNALECYLKAFYLKEGVQSEKNYMNTHEILGIINACKKHDKTFFNWLNLLKFQDIKFYRNSESEKQMTQEQFDKYKIQMTDPEFYMLVLLGPSLKYGALDKKHNVTTTFFVSGSNRILVSIINEIRNRLNLNEDENCLLKNNIKNGNLPQEACQYLNQFI